MIFHPLFVSQHKRSSIPATSCRSATLIKVGEQFFLQTIIYNFAKIIESRKKSKIFILSVEGNALRVRNGLKFSSGGVIGVGKAPDRPDPRRYWTSPILTSLLSFELLGLQMTSGAPEKLFGRLPQFASIRAQAFKLFKSLLAIMAIRKSALHSPVLRKSSLELPALKSTGS